MLAPEDESGILQRASYAAYTEAVKTAYRSLSESIAQYFDEHREFDNKDDLGVPGNFRPLKNYERMLKIQKLTLQLALRAADQLEGKSATIPANGHDPSPTVQAASMNESRQVS